MIRSAHRRFASDSSPPELRLLVMKASVPYHASTFAITGESRFKDLAQIATTLFDTQQVADPADDSLLQIAEQALLETCIFTIKRKFEISSH
jgi:hypothetical protein